MKTLIFFLDAVRPDYISRSVTPFMHELSQKHTFLPLISLLGFSSGIHPSIWTGTWQEEHGKFLVYKYAPEESKFKWFRFFKFIPEKLRSFLFAATKIPYYYLPAFRKYLPKWYRERFLELPSTIDPSLAPYFATDKEPFKGHNMLEDIEKKYSVEYVGDHRNPPVFNKGVPVEDWELSDKDIDFFFTYDTDGFGHSYGPHSKELNNLMSKIDRSVERLYKEAQEKHADVKLFIFSDHGMCEVKKFLNVKDKLENLPYSVPEDYIAFFDASMIRFWTDKKEVKKELIKFIESIPQLTYLDAKLKKKYHVNFKGREFGDIMAIVEPETRLFPDYFAPVKAAIKGLHGYDPRFEHSKGIWITNCEMDGRYKEIRVVDILPTIIGSLGLRPPGQVAGKNLARGVR